jgi:hypothetical protein
MRRFISNEAMRRHLGVLVTPNTGGDIARISTSGLPWCVDNACWDFERFDGKKYLSLLRKAKAAVAQPVFVTMPDQAPRPEEADHSHCHACTSYLFERWLRVLAFERLDLLPLAFVLQNGIESEHDVPWDCIDAVFIGGDDEFKLSDLVMMELIPAAKARGKHVHLGRVNGRRRLWHAVLADVDSVDGSSLSRFPDTYIPRFIARARVAEMEAERLDSLSRAMERDIEQLEGRRAAAG